MSKIIENIRVIRLSKGLTQEELSQFLNIDVSTYGKIERGQIELTVQRFEKIAHYFNMSVCDVILFPETQYETTDLKKAVVTVQIELNENDILKIGLKDRIMKQLM